MTMKTSKLKLVFKPRLDYIDIAKCIGMFTIIWGHIIHTGWSNQIVYAFHIPLFFFMSGMVFDSSKYLTVRDLLKKRFQTLLLPYLIFSLITWLMWVGMRVISNDTTNYWYPLLQTFIAQGSSGFLRHNLPLWFVTCLFSVEILYYFINKLPKIGTVFVCVICSFIGCYMDTWGGCFWRNLIWSFDGTLISVLFYGSGQWLIRACSHEKLQTIVKHNSIVGWSMILLLTIVLYFSSVYNGYVSIGSNRLGNYVSLFYLNSYLGIVAFLMFSIYLSALNLQTRICRMMMNYIKWFGQNSFYVMATHFPIKEILGRTIDKLFDCNVHSDIGYASIVFIITLVIDTIVVWCCCTVKQKWNKRKQMIAISL